MAAAVQSAAVAAAASTTRTTSTTTTTRSDEDENSSPSKSPSSSNSNRPPPPPLHSLLPFRDEDLWSADELKIFSDEGEFPDGKDGDGSESGLDGSAAEELREEKSSLIAETELGIKQESSSALARSISSCPSSPPATTSSLGFPGSSSYAAPGQPTGPYYDGGGIPPPPLSSSQASRSNQVESPRSSTSPLRTTAPPPPSSLSPSSTFLYDSSSSLGSPPPPPPPAHLPVPYSLADPGKSLRSLYSMSPSAHSSYPPPYSLLGPSPPPPPPPPPHMSASNAEMAQFQSWYGGLLSSACLSTSAGSELPPPAAPTPRRSMAGSREKKIEKNHIKKPLNAFMLYMKEMRPRIVAECTLKESAAINQILGRRWHGLSREEQAKYYELARKERQLHMQMYPGWSARDNYAQNKKKKRKRIQEKPTSSNSVLSPSTSEQPLSPSNSSSIASKKCRARYGIDQQDLWCRPCNSPSASSSSPMKSVSAAVAAVDSLTSALQQHHAAPFPPPPPPPHLTLGGSHPPPPPLMMDMHLNNNGMDSILLSPSDPLSSMPPPPPPMTLPPASNGEPPPELFCQPSTSSPKMLAAAAAAAAIAVSAAGGVGGGVRPIGVDGVVEEQPKYISL